MDLVHPFDGTESATYYDRWSSWSLVLNQCHFLLAAAWGFVLLVVAQVNQDKPPIHHYWGFDKWDGSRTLKECPFDPRRNSYDCPGRNPAAGVPWYAYERPYNIPTWELWAALVPIILAIINGPPQEWHKLWILSYLRNEKKRLLVSALAHTAQLVVCSLLVMGDYSRHDTSFLFWFPLFFWFVPAAICFGHGLIGLHAAFLSYGPSIRLSDFGHISGQEPTVSCDSALVTAIDSRSSPEVSLLEPTVREPSQQEHTEASGSELSMALESHRRSHVPLLDLTVPNSDEEGFLNPDADVASSTPRYWHTPNIGSYVPLPAARFPWQVKVNNTRANHAWRMYWVPLMMSFLGQTAPYNLLRVARWRNRVDQELNREMTINTLVPMFVTIIADIALLVALLRRRFTFIFIATSGQGLATAIWLVASVVFSTTWTARPDYLIFFAPGFAFNQLHLFMASLRLEWEPDFWSFGQMISGREEFVDFI